MAGTDPVSPIAPARVRALLLPVGKIDEIVFLNFAHALQTQSTIRLGDVTPDGRPDKNLFSPLAFPNGRVLFDFSTSLPSTSPLRVSTIELFREVMVVIGIANGEVYSSSGMEPHGDIHDLQEAMGRAREQFPKALSLNLVLFNVSDRTLFKHFPIGTMMVPPLETTRSNTLKTVMCDITSMFLAEMTTYARNITNLQTLEALNMFFSDHGSNLPGFWSNSHDNDRSSTSASLEGQSRPLTPVNNNSTIQSGSSTPQPQSPRLISSSTGPGGSKHDSLHGEAGPLPFVPNQVFPSGKPSAEETNRHSQVHETNTSREASRDRRSILSQGLSSVGDRARNQLKVRQGIIIGTLYLHAGLWHDALRELVESTTRARANSDHLWHAKGLENILVTMLLLLWSQSEFQIPAICHPVTEKSFASIMHISSKSDDMTKGPTEKDDTNDSLLRHVTMLIPDLLNMIMNTHIRANSAKGETLSQFAFSEFTIRSAYLMSLVGCVTSQLTVENLDHIVMEDSFRSNSDKHIFLRSSRLSKHDIVTFLFRALPSLQPESVTVPENIHIHCGIARVLSLLDLPRKRAFILRKILLEVFPGLIQARKVGAAEAGVHPAAGLTAWNTLNTFNTSKSSVSLEQDTGQHLDGLLEVVCRTYGAHVGEFILARNKTRVSVAKHTAQVMAPIENSVERCQHGVIDEPAQRDFGGIALKTDVLQLCMNVCEALPNFAGILQYATTYLKVIHPMKVFERNGDSWIVQATKDEQSWIASKILRTVAAVPVAKLKDIECPYWDNFLICGIRIADPELSFRLTSHKISDVDWVSKGPLTPTSREYGPFIYEPFTKPKVRGVNKVVIVCGEQSGFIIAFRNIYDFEIVVEDVQILSEGVKIACIQQSFTIGPCMVHQQTVSGLALSHGDMHLTGCNVKIRGCVSQHFLLYDTAWQEDNMVQLNIPKLVESSDVSLRYTSSLKTSVFDVLSPTCLRRPTAFRLSVLVLEPQPLLAITDTSVARSTLMLLEGETRSLFITVQNLSESTMIDFVNISFEDSTLAFMHSRLGSGLNSADSFELEYQASHCQALKWRRSPDDTNFRIMPGASAIFEVEVFGKAGLTDATVRIDYAYLGKPVQHLKDDFYVRHVVLPIVVTVNASVQLQKVEILPAVPDQLLLKINQENLESGKSSNLDIRTIQTSNSPQTRFAAAEATSPVGRISNAHNGLFTLLLELRNAWPRTLSLSVQVAALSNDCSETKDSLVSTATFRRDIDIYPGQAARVAVVLPQIQADDLLKAIPPLNANGQKQFILTDMLLSESERSEREMFWSRQQILARVTAHWSERSSGRHGNTELRGLRISPRMVDIMREDSVGIVMNIDPSNKGPVTNTSTGRLTFNVVTNTSLALTVRLHNRSRKVIWPLLRLQPRLANQPYHIALDLTRRLAWTGLLQQTGLQLKPDETTELRLEICVLCDGEYEIGAIVHDLSTDEAFGTAQAKFTNADEDTAALSVAPRTLVGISLCRIISAERYN